LEPVAELVAADGHGELVERSELVAGEVVDPERVKVAMPMAHVEDVADLAGVDAKGCPGGAVPGPEFLGEIGKEDEVA